MKIPGNVKLNTLAILLGCGIAITGIYVVVFVVDRTITDPGDRAFRSKFDNVKIGMAETDVLDRLGEPDDRTHRFYLGQEQGYEAAYLRARESNSDYFLVWKKEISLVYAIGITKDKKVSLKEKGGS